MDLVRPRRPDVAMLAVFESPKHGSSDWNRGQRTDRDEPEVVARQLLLQLLRLFGRHRALLEEGGEISVRERPREHVKALDVVGRRLQASRVVEGVLVEEMPI